MQINIRQIKYLNNIIEQDHRGVKRMVNPMMGFKPFNSTQATIAGIKLYHMLKKGQHVNAENSSVFDQFYALAAVFVWENCVYKFYCLIKYLRRNHI